MLPALPQILRIHPNRLAAEHWSARHAQGCRTGDADVTFDELFAALGALPGWRAVDSYGGRFIVRALLARSHGRLSSAAHDPWGVRATHDALMELRLAGVTSRALAGGTPAPSVELTDLGALLGAYEDALHTYHLHDAADIQRQAVLDVVQGNVPSPWDTLERIDVMVGTELFGARLDLLNAFCARRVAVHVHLPWDDERPHAFAWPEAMLHSAESRGHQVLRVHTDTRVGQGEGAMQALRAAQFAGRKVDASQVQVIRVADGDEHRQQILQHVSAWLREGVPPHAIAIVTPDASMALPLVRTFTRAGVPAFTRRGAALGESRAAQIVLTALDAVHNGMPREALAELWQACGATVETPEDPWSARRVTQTLRRLRLQTCASGEVRAAWLSDPGYPAVAPEVIHAVCDALDAFMARLMALPLEDGLEPGLVSLVQLLVDAAPKSIDPTGPASIAAEAFLQVRQSLLQLVQAARLSPEPVLFERAELIDWLRMLFDDKRQAPPGVRSGAVRVFSPDEIVGTSFKRVFVVGANLGAFPRLAPADPVLTDSLRHAINARLGPRLIQYGPLQGRGALPGDARDTWLWLEILASCEEAVTVSCAPGEDDAGPSELVDELLRSTRMEMATPPPSYASPHPASLTTWMQAWAQAHPRRGLVGAGGVPFAALDAALAQHLSARHKRVTDATFNLWERHDAGGMLPALGTHTHGWVAQSVLGRTQSTSRMDTLGMCRYKHFAQGILGLSQEDVATLGANPREEGSIAHAGLHVVYHDILAHGGMQVARRDPAATVARAKDVFWQDTATLLRETVVHPLLQRATLLDAWRAVEVQLALDLRQGDAEPVALEYRFDDRPGADADAFTMQHPAHPERTLKIRGSIDRVDVSGGTVATLDYKRTVKKRSLGRHFQLAIYGAVARRDLKPDATAVDAAWIELWEGKRKGAEGLSGPPETMEAYLHAHLWPRIDPLLAGEITPDPDDTKGCVHCQFAGLCRVGYEGVAAQEEE